MERPDADRAVAVAASTAASLRLGVDRAVVLHDSNKLTLRLLPCDVVARVAPVAQQDARFEVELARRLANVGAPVAALDPRVEPRVYERDGFVVTLWTYYDPATVGPVLTADYADALDRLHAGLREVDLAAPHFSARVDQAQRLVADRERSPALAETDRELLADTLRRLRRTVADDARTEQLLHGEPHPGNVISTERGPLLVDFETCCRGPVEFDLAHAPEGVGERYPGVDRQLLGACRVLVLAVATTWRWDRADQLPNGRQLGVEWLAQLRAAVT